MLLYTVSNPENFIDIDLQKSDTAKYYELEGENYRLMIEIISPTTGKIIRLISPCPDYYLNPSLQPGNIISLLHK